MPLMPCAEMVSSRTTDALVIPADLIWNGCDETHANEHKTLSLLLVNLVF